MHWLKNSLWENVAIIQFVRGVNTNKCIYSWIPYAHGSCNELNNFSPVMQLVFGSSLSHTLEHYHAVYMLGGGYIEEYGLKCWFMLKA